MKRSVNWIALLILAYVVAGMLFGQGVYGFGAYLVFLTLTLAAAVWFGRRYFARRDRALFPD